MVNRTFLAFDNESLIVDSSPNSSLVGNPIINNSDTPDGTIFTYSSGFGRTITLDDTSNAGGRGRFNDDDLGNHTIVDGGGLVANGTPVELESRIDLRALDEDGDPTGRVITIYVFSKDGNFNDIWGYAARSPLQDGTSYIKVDGSNDGTSVYGQYIDCFAADTLIDTPDGARAAGALSAGDLVWTLAQGAQPIIWGASTTVAGVGAFSPVRIKAGALDNSTDLLVSQQHRLRIASAVADLYFGVPEVLVPAKHLCGLPGIDVIDMPQITYTHFMFDRHHIVRANGQLAESFFLAKNSISSLEADVRRELSALFPLDPANVTRFGGTAAMTLKTHEARAVAAHLM